MIKDCQDSQVEVTIADVEQNQRPCKVTEVKGNEQSYAFHSKLPSHASKVEVMSATVECSVIAKAMLQKPCQDSLISLLDFEAIAS